MRKFSIPLAIALATICATPVWAMYQTGGITGIDTEHRRITLDSSVTYPVAAKVDISNLAIEDHIRFDTETRNGQPIITKIIKGY